MSENTIGVLAILVCSFLAAAEAQEPAKRADLTALGKMRPALTGECRVEKGLATLRNSSLFMPDMCADEMVVSLTLELLSPGYRHIGIRLYTDNTPSDFLKPGFQFSGGDYKLKLSGMFGAPNVSKPLRLDAGKPVAVKAYVLSDRKIFAKAWPADQPEPGRWSVKHSLAAGGLAPGAGLTLDVRGGEVRFSNVAVQKVTAPPDETSFRWEVVVDDSESGCELKGSWRGTRAEFAVGGSCRVAKPGDVSATWKLDVANAGEVLVWASIPYDPVTIWERATEATYHVTGDGIDFSRTANFKSNDLWNDWLLLGKATLSKPGAVSVTLEGRANGTIVADAVRATPAE